MAELCADHPPLFQPRATGWRIALAPAAMLSLGDFASIATIPFAGSLLRQSTENLQRNFCFWTLATFITIILIASHDGYRSLRGVAARRQTGVAVNCFLAVSLAMLALAVLLGHPHILARRWTFADLLVTPFMLGAARAGLGNRLALAAANTAGPLVVCFDHCPAGLQAALAASHISGRISGVLYLKPGHPAAENWPKLASIELLLAAMQRGHVQDVVFIHHPALDALAATAHQELLAELMSYSARIWLGFDVAANLPEILQGRSGSCKIVPVVTDELVTSVNLTKRLFDLFAATVLLLLACPLLAFCACLVKAGSPGPVIFRQMRTGAHGRQFTVLKFRTMANTPGPFAQATRRDPRVTKIGRFLRNTSLDEILQLINVIKGEMSLVGPRPHAPETEVEGITFENAVRMYRLRHRVKPGITGLAQIRGQRGETKAVDMLEQRLASDLEYIQSWSFWLDLYIMLRTIPIVLAQTNAC